MTRLFGLIRRLVESGQPVEIEGLGTFRASHGAYRDFEPQTKPQVFIAYVAEDLALARQVRDGLAKAGCAVWLDRDKLLAGQNWPRAIQRAIEISDVFVACFSKRSLAKRGQFQTELRFALECARRVPLDSVFVVPVRFEECNVPRKITEDVQYVDLFPEWERGMKRLVKSIRRAAPQRVAARLTT